LLIDIVAKPHQASGADSLSALASAGAQVAEREQKLQAQQQAEAAAREARAQLARSAMEILAENVERLWGKIHGQAPNARRKPIKRMLSCELGDCTLAIDFSEHNYVEYGVFKHSGWDVVVATQAIVTQYDPRYIWGSSLWYAKPHGASDYRWYELSFWCWGHSEFQPYASTNNEDSDLAVSRIMHNVNVAFGPTIIDDEKEDEFHERWIWLLSKASVGKLRQPATLPINQWPPNLV